LANSDSVKDRHGKKRKFRRVVEEVGVGKRQISKMEKL
jgi:hypothetical protein